MLLEVPLVIGRDSREKLSRCAISVLTARSLFRSGSLTAPHVECAYHGWQFDAHTGQCRAIPSLTADSKLKCERIHAGSFPCAGARRLHLGPHDQPGGPGMRSAPPPVARIAHVQAMTTRTRISGPTCLAAWTRPS